MTPRKIRKIAVKMLDEQLKNIDQNILKCELRSAEDQASYNQWYENDLKYHKDSGCCDGSEQYDYRNQPIVIEEYDDQKIIITVKLDAWRANMARGHSTWTKFHRMVKKAVVKRFPDVRFKDYYMNLSSKPKMIIWAKDDTPWKKFA